MPCIDGLRARSTQPRPEKRRKLNFAVTKICYTFARVVFKFSTSLETNWLKTRTHRLAPSVRPAGASEANTRRLASQQCRVPSVPFRAQQASSISRPQQLLKYIFFVLVHDLHQGQGRLDWIVKPRGFFYDELLFSSALLALSLLLSFFPVSRGVFFFFSPCFSSNEPRSCSGVC